MKKEGFQMTEKVRNLDELFADSLKDLYDAEQQIVKALPKMINQAQSNELKQGFQEHLDVTHKQIDRLDQIFKELKMPVKGKHCKGIEGIIQEGNEMMQEMADPMVKDAALIAAAQKVEHYEIAGYGTARAYAQALGHQSIAKLLDQTADEEGQADKKLTKLAESHINAKAKAH
jgi:ferritin-like metal-binding protein YciE